MVETEKGDREFDFARDGRIISYEHPYLITEYAVFLAKKKDTPDVTKVKVVKQKR